MTEIGFLSDLLLLLGLALGSAWLSRRLHQSPIVGYLLTGMLVGPSGLHLLGRLHDVEILAEVGVILLLFTIGLEFPLGRIRDLKRLMFACGGPQVALTALFVFAGCRALGQPTGAATILALAMALSSTAIILKLLLERGELDTGHGKVAVAILLFQDLCAVLFLVLLPLLAGRAAGFTPLGALRSTLLLAALALFARYLLQPLIRAVVRTRTPELFRLTLLALVLGTAWLTARAGLSMALGAFLAGLFLAESDYSHQALADILPFRDTFLALFFVSMGMLVDLHQLADHWSVILALTAVLLLGKVLLGTAAAALAGYPLRISLLSGLLLFQVGEFSFVLLKEALQLGAISAGLYQGALSLAVLSMIATPLAVTWAPTLAARLATLFGGANGAAGAAQIREKSANLHGHVIIAGYGHSGRNVGQILRRMQIPHLFVEVNGEAVRRGRQSGDLIVYGDATLPAVLAELGVERARALVLAINDPAALCRAIRAGRELGPDLFILARTRFLAELDRLRELGADEIIPDELEAGLQLSAVLLRRLGVGEGRALQLLAGLRREHYASLRRPSPGSTSFGRLPEGQFDFQAIPDDSPCLDHSLAELAFRTRTGATVAGVIRGERTLYSPPADFVLKRGDTLILLSDDEAVLRVRELLSGNCN